MISFAIPNFNRTTNVIKLIEHHKDDNRIKEIIICDDNSTPQVNVEIESFIQNIPKVKLIKNKNNLGPYGNKARTVEHCSSEWVVLCDSDNFIDKEYIDVLYQETPWQEDTSYCPSFAKPRFDYRGLSNFNVDSMVKLNEINQQVHDLTGPCFLNTGNFFFNRNKYIEIATQGMSYCLEKHSCDVIAFNYFWIRGGNKMKCVEGLEYLHDSESGDSIYRTEAHLHAYKVQDRLNQVNMDIHTSAMEVV